LDYFLAAFLRVAFFLVAFFFVAAFLVAFFFVAFRLEAFFLAAITGFPPLSIALFIPVGAGTSNVSGSTPAPSSHLGPALRPTWVSEPIEPSFEAPHSRQAGFGDPNLCVQPLGCGPYRDHAQAT
jgi:hypothetical protein